MPAHTKSPFLRLRIERSEISNESTRLDIVKAVRREYDSGHLPAGSRLPPVRVLQHQLGVAKNTIQGAYEELVAQGIVVNETRRGYFVLAGRERSKSFTNSKPAMPVLVKTSTLQQLTRSRKREPPIRLGSAFIDADLLPRERVTECFRAILKR